jgi:hypothetical protein
VAKEPGLLEVCSMTTVVADMSVSLDGFVAEPDGGVERVFAWYGRRSRTRSRERVPPRLADLDCG